MKLQAERQGLIWGGLLVLFGAALLVQEYTELSAWVWVAILIVAGFIALGLYLTDRSKLTLLIPAYALWAIAGLVALTELDILQNAFTATYVLIAIALPFLVVFLRNRAQWWALIPVYVLLAIGVMIPLTEAGVLSDLLVPTYIMFAIAIPFFVVYVRDRTQWWALIPVYALLAIGVMIPLIEAGVLSDLLVPAYIMFAIAIPFFVVYARDRALWWALIPGGIMAIMGFSFLIAEAAVEYIAAVALVLVGVWMLARAFTRREPIASDAPTPTSPEADEPPAE